MHPLPTLPPGLVAVIGDERTGKTTLLRRLAGEGPGAPDGLWLDLALPGDDQRLPADVWADLRVRYPSWNDTLHADLVEALGLTPHAHKPLYMHSTGSRRKLGLVAAVLAVIFLVWTLIKSGWELPALVLFALAAVSLLGAIFMATKGREGWAFVGTFLTIALAVAGLFVVLFPAVMPASNDPALSLMAGHNPAVGISAASTTYTLTVMTWVAVIFTPIVLIYQGWTYWVFRKRIATHHIPAVDVPETVSA